MKHHNSDLLLDIWIIAGADHSDNRNVRYEAISLCVRLSLSLSFPVSGKAVTSVLAGGVLYLAGRDVRPAPSAQITHGSGTFHSGAPALLVL